MLRAGASSTAGPRSGRDVEECSQWRGRRITQVEGPTRPSSRPPPSRSRRHLHHPPFPPRIRSRAVGCIQDRSSAIHSMRFFLVVCLHVCRYSIKFSSTSRPFGCEPQRTPLGRRRLTQVRRAGVSGLSPLQLTWRLDSPVSLWRLRGSNRPGCRPFLCPIVVVCFGRSPHPRRSCCSRGCYEDRRLQRLCHRTFFFLCLLRLRSRSPEEACTPRDSFKEKERWLPWRGDAQVSGKITGRSGQGHP